MQQSNTYIILFSLGLTIVLGSLLTIAAIGLKPQQEKARMLDTRKQILRTVVDLDDDVDIFKMFDDRIKGIVLDAQGQEIKSDVIAEKVSIEKNYNIVKKLDVNKGKNLQLPVFIYDENNDSNAEAYIFPVYGNGLWDKIWGWIALKPNMESVVGVVFDHKGETPGLGARITDEDVQKRFKGKNIWKNNKLVGIEMIKGEGNNPSKIDTYQVDGMSGATLTANGLSHMIKRYIKIYKPYIESIKK